MTTRQSEYNAREQKLYLALELSRQKWLLAFSVGLGQEPRMRKIAGGDMAALAGEIEKARKRFGLAQQVEVASCYEAGRDGFWLHRCLRRMGVDNLVVDSASIPVDRRARRAKSDGIDGGQLLRLLMRFHLGEQKVWRVVRVPSVEDEDRRQAHRELETLQGVGRDLVNRIKGLLATQGIRKVSGIEKWGAREIEGLRNWEKKSLPPQLKQRLYREVARVQSVKEEIRQLEKQRAEVVRESQGESEKKVRQLMELKAIGMGSSTVFVYELFGWRDFCNGKEVGSAAGLAPTPYQSGDSKREQGISKAGNRRVRRLAVLIAWRWIRYQPQSRLTQWFERRFARGGVRARKVGIVALARKLLIELWRFVKTGAIPEGALLKGEGVA